MLTALTSLNDKIEGYDAGADDYIIKPFEFRELVMKIRVLLKRSVNQNIPQGSVLKAGDLEMLQDLITAAVNGAGKKVDDSMQSVMGGMLGGMGIPGI